MLHFVKWRTKWGVKNEKKINWNFSNDVSDYNNCCSGK